MLGSKYLSELVDFKRLRSDAINIIMAPTGSGKTFFALHAVPEHCSDAHHQVLYLIDTINGKEQILRNYKACPATRDWIEQVDQGSIWFVREETVVIMTYALLGTILIKMPNFCERFKYIICDELHNLINFQNFTKKPNAHSIAKDGLEKVVIDNKSTLIALSATPDKIKTEFKNVDCNTIPIDLSEVRRYEIQNTNYYPSLNNLIHSLDPNKTGLCYTGRINKMKEIARVAAAAGLRPIAIWSINSNDHHMSEEQLRVRSIILEQSVIPSEYNFLIINNSSETSIKIKSKVDYVIVNNSNKDIQTQVRGRVDSDLHTLYLPSKETDLLVIPEEFLNTELSTTDKERLCEVLDIRGKNGRQKKWTSIKKALQKENSGYSIRETRHKDCRFSIITENK